MVAKNFGCVQRCPFHFYLGCHGIRTDLSDVHNHTKVDFS